MNLTLFVEKSPSRRIRTILIVAALIALPLFVSIEARGSEALQGEGFCLEVERDVNVLADFTTTKCLPGRGRKKGLVSLILISEQPVFVVPKAKKGWILVVVGAVGKVASDNPDVALDEISVSDTNLLEKREYFVFPASEARRLQHQIYTGALTIDQAYDQLSPKLKEKTVPASPK